jgi:hypothetical protein
LVAGARVFVVLADRSVAAFDLENGQLLWTQQRTGEPLVLKQNGVLFAYQNNLLAGMGGHLVSLNPDNGQIVWDVAIANAVQSLRVRRENQFIDGARSIVETAKKMMALKVVQAFEPGGESDAKRRAEEKLKSKVRTLEQKFRKRIKELFHHSEERWRLPEEFEWDLFSQHTWKLLGVSKKWIVISGAVAGASAGALLDIANGGASVGLATLIVGVIGGAAAYYFADNVANFKILGNKLGGHSVEACIERRSKAASILIARLVAYSMAVANRPHGNRAKDDATDKSEGFIASLEADKDYPRFASLVELWHRGIKTEKSESAEEWFCDRVLNHISKS